MTEIDESYYEGLADGRKESEAELARLRKDLKFEHARFVTQSETLARLRQLLDLETTRRQDAQELVFKLNDELARLREELDGYIEKAVVLAAAKVDLTTALKEIVQLGYDPRDIIPKYSDALRIARNALKGDQ